MSANLSFTSSLSDMFSVVTLCTKSGVTHVGKRPSEIDDLDTPFRSVSISLDSGEIISPLDPPDGTEVYGYDVVINVIAEMFSQKSIYRWKLISLLTDGRKWCTYVDLNFNINGEFE